MPHVARRQLLVVLVASAVCVLLPHGGYAMTGTPRAAATPWIALIVTNEASDDFLGIPGVREEPLCSGAVVGDGWVLTAAHCVAGMSRSGLRVLVGRSARDARGEGAAYGIARIAMMPGFQNGVKNDAALIQLNDFDSRRWHALPLATESQVVNAPGGVTLYGYGAIGFKRDSRGRLIYQKRDGREVLIPVVDGYLRKSPNGALVRSPGCDSNMICFTSAQKTVIVHKGDSGGPWLRWVSGAWQLISVVSGWVGPIEDDNTRGSSTLASLPDGRTMFQWVRDTVGVPTVAAGTIVRDPVAGNSWMVAPDGYRNWIPTGGDYLCFKGKGYRVVNLQQIVIDGIPDRVGVHAKCSPSSPSPPPPPPTRSYGIINTGGIGVRARTQPTVNSPWTYGAPEGATVDVVCQTLGEPMGGYGNRLWFFVNYGGKQFYVNDTFTNSPHQAADPPLPGIPMCGGDPSPPPPPPGKGSVTVSVNGSGSVTSSPGGISCPSACSGSFTAGTSVTLTAHPASGSMFSGWSGACGGTGATCTVALAASDSKSASASFGPSSTPNGTLTYASALAPTAPHGFVTGTPITFATVARNPSGLTVLAAEIRVVIRGPRTLDTACVGGVNVILRPGGTFVCTASITFSVAGTYSIWADWDSGGGHWHDGQLGPHLQIPIAASGIGDTQPPTTPGSLQASVGGPTTVTLSWTASADDVGVVAYDVYQNGTRISDSVTGTSFTITNLACATPYQFGVDARDAVPYTSTQATVTVTTSACPPSSSPPPIAFVQTADSTHAQSGSVTTRSFTSTTGNLLVVAVAAQNMATTQAFSSVADNKGNTYSKAGSYVWCCGNPSYAVEIWYSSNIAGGSGHIVTANSGTTTTLGSSSNVFITVQEFSGIAHSSAFDVTAGTAATSANPDSGNTATTSQANELVFGAALGGTFAINPGSGFSNSSSVNHVGSNGGNFAVESKVVSSAGAYSATFGMAPTSWAAVVATFRAGS